MPNKDPLIVNTITVTKGGSIENELLTDQHKNFWAASGQPVLATAGTDTAWVANRLMVTKIFIPCKTTLTGLAYQIGSVGGTDRVVVSIYSASGTLLANSTLASGGTVCGTAANIQGLDFTRPLVVSWPAWYWVGVNVSGTTCKVRTYPIPWAKFFTGLLTQTTAIPANITPPTSYTADYAPFIMTY